MAWRGWYGGVQLTGFDGGEGGVQLFQEGWSVGVLRVARGVKSGLCAGHVEAVPLLVLRQGGRVCYLATWSGVGEAGARVCACAFLVCRAGSWWRDMPIVWQRTNWPYHTIGLAVAVFSHGPM